MRVGVDDNGYFFDLDTGLYLTLYYDENGNAVNAATGEPVTYVDFGDVGGPVGYTVYGGGGVDLNHLIDIAGQTAVGIAGGAGQTGQYIPIQGRQPQGQYGGSGGGRGTGGAGPGGLGAGINLSTNTLIIIALVAGAFVLGGRRR